MLPSTFCRFGDLPVAARFVHGDGSARLECTSPVMPVGVSPVLLTSNDQNYFDDGLTFEHAQWPSLTALLPTQGPALGGTVVHLAGVLSL